VPNNTERLCRHLGYAFKNIHFLTQALTHCSVGATNNERFEFLGDAVLSFVIANALFLKYPNQTEGDLSRLRAYLVRGEMLAKIAAELELGDYLYLGQGELKTGGFRRASILSDALEAVFAAVFFDGGFDKVQEVILKVYDSRLNDPELYQNLKDSKTQLQEYLQAKKCSLPEYTLDTIQGEEHEQVFHVSCRVSSLKLIAKGQADNRRKAEQNAALQMIHKLKRT
jgi:ribonuclease-3